MNLNGLKALAGTALFVGFNATIFGAIISAIEWRRRSRLEALVHGFNSIGLVLAFTGGIMAADDLGRSTPLWLGYAVFLPLAFGNVICSAVAASQARKLDRVEIDRTLKNTLAATTVTTAISYFSFAILSRQYQPGWAISVITGVTFLSAFLISCRTLKIVNSQRRLLRRAAPD